MLVLSPPARESRRKKWSRHKRARTPTYYKYIQIHGRISKNFTEILFHELMIKGH